MGFVSDALDEAHLLGNQRPGCASRPGWWCYPSAAASKARGPRMPSCCFLIGLGVAPRPPPAALGLLLRRRMASNRAFQLRLNPLTGDSEWLVVDEEEEAPSHHRQLLVATSYLDMLNDTARNRAYRHAIDATVTDPTSRVLDIG